MCLHSSQDIALIRNLNFMFYSVIVSGTWVGCELVSDFTYTLGCLKESHTAGKYCCI